MYNLENKVVIVTGAAQGQGESHARQFTEAGATTILTDINTQAVQKVAASLGDRAHYMHHDVASAESWQKVVEQTERDFGTIDVLVNNAAIDLQKTLEDTTEEDYRRIVDINQVSVFLGMKAVAAPMRRAGGGSIVNISSIVGLHRVSRLRVAYVASKFAVRGMTKVAALELAQYGIRVNSVHPGFVETPMLAEAGHKEAIAQIPLGRPAKTSEISNLVLFLASDASSYITGTEHLVDGGLSNGF